MSDWQTRFLPNNWLDACSYLKQQQQPFCIATIVAEAGSVPRATGAKMVISQQQQFDTLGGGNLEFSVIKHAREQLEKGTKSNHIERFSLAADLAQCCGGAVQVLFEYFLVDQPLITIYGAGHVSHCLCEILAKLPVQVQVIDNRQQWLDSIGQFGVNTHYHAQPENSVAELKANSYVVILSQDHSLDFALSLAALRRGDLAFVGVIGSQTKAQRFKYRLAEQLENPARCDQLTCPIGLAEVSGKLPMQVAVSISAQLITLLEKHAKTSDRDQQKQQWESSNTLRKQLAGEQLNE